MKLILETKDFKHLKDKSQYNYNYYISNKGLEILEICHEDYNFYEFRLIEGERWELLGSSYRSFKDEVIEVDFREFYT